jgi:hypothetical protein
MKVEAIKQELENLSPEQLDAIKNIFEFNLRGVLIGDRDEIQQKLNLVNAEIARRNVINNYKVKVSV